MKKPVIFVISLIYLLSIAIVGFLGITPRVDNPVIYPTGISLTFDEKLSQREHTANNDFYCVIKADEEVSFTITANVTPNTATNKELNFVKLDEHDSSVYTYSTEFDGEKTTATFNCSAVPEDESVMLKLKVCLKDDSDKSLVKTIEILVHNYDF